jgi:sigma54-dependent transcription regulator
VTEEEEIGARTALPPLPRPLLQLLRRSPITVFVVGGTTAQRELAARRLHHESIVHDGPFVRVDCEQEEEALCRSFEGWLGGTPGEPAADPVARASGGTLGGPSPGRPGGAARLIVGNERDLGAALADGRFHVALFDYVDQYRVNLG